jgi:holliday junction DNA helicase RuvA
LIGFLRGRVVDVQPENMILDVNGVGYELQASGNTLDSAIHGDELTLFVHTHVREDAITLFGFSTMAEKRLFLSLISVNGVGPKLAIKALSGGSVDRLVDMIDAGDVKALTALPKIGKKIAEQIILSLKGKLVLDDERTTTKTPGKTRSTSPRGELVSALVNLGFRLQDVEKVVEDMPPGTDLQSGIRQGLQALTGQF